VFKHILLVVVLIGLITTPAAAQTDTATATPNGTDTATATPIEPSEPQSPTELWDNPLAFIAIVVLGMTGLIAVMSRSLAMGAWTGYLAFVHISLEADIGVFRSIALVTMVLVFLGAMFKLVRLEFEGED